MPAPPDPLLEPWSLPYDPLATVDDIRACFRLILGRNPHREEWTGHCGNAGQPLPAVVANYVNSLEFARRGLLARAAPDAQVADWGDFRIYASPHDQAVGRHVLGGAYEPDVTAILRRFLRPGMAMLDIGANIGVFTMLGAACVGPGGSVLAVEPNPANARLLEASRRLNGFAHVTLCQAAAGRAIGLLGLHAFDSNGTTSAIGEAGLLQGAQSVAALPVDLLVPPGRRVDLVKIDVEGAEHSALLGCEATLRRCMPVIVSEFSPDQMAGISGIDGPGYLRWLAGLGYRISVIGEGGALDEPGVAPEPVMARYVAAARDHIDIACLPPGVGIDALR